MKLAKTQTAWALVNKRGHLVLFDGRCPIYWKRIVAANQGARRNAQAKNTKCWSVVKVTIAAS
jgi:hypothetical protein